MKTLLIILLIAIFTFPACKSTDSANSNPPPPPPVINSDINVQLTFQVENLEARKPKIVGQTNLPEGTQLGVWIKSKSADYDAQTNVTVHNGRFESPEFSFSTKPLPKGKYEVDVTMPISETQAQSVREIIGLKGEKLKGDLVKIDSSQDATVKIKQEFQIK